MAPADSRAASATGINIMTCHLPSKCRLKQVSAELAEGPATPTLSVPKEIACGHRGTALEGVSVSTGCGSLVSIGRCNASAQRPWLTCAVDAWGSAYES